MQNVVARRLLTDAFEFANVNLSMLFNLLGRPLSDHPLPSTPLQTFFRWWRHLQPPSSSYGISCEWKALRGLFETGHYTV
jgi:hypothetical protein